MAGWMSILLEALSVRLNVGSLYCQCNLLKNVTINELIRCLASGSWVYKFETNLWSLTC